MGDKFRQTRDMARSLLRGSITEDAAEQFLAQVIEHIHVDHIKPLESENHRMREYLWETSGRLQQLASDSPGLSPRDMRALARDMMNAAASEDPGAD
jgi:hypothetical protein